MDSPIERYINIVSSKMNRIWLWTTCSLLPLSLASCMRTQPRRALPACVLMSTATAQPPWTNPPLSHSCDGTTKCMNSKQTSHKLFAGAFSQLQSSVPQRGICVATELRNALTPES
ncbi:uncharacterized protein LOC126415592 [Schistocerca serialis cubense]|uniref:uncharacterized protein LOC126415592 n=1 Tax=Schistocerca serialis cubense TaxID=2023355 RepID=UPI00214F2098|nr:uncharacterized protein LOC126415592 [Schistocerca serialis cubense]